MQNIYELLCGCAGGENVRRQEPMSLHTTFRIGGPADLFVTPGSIQAVADSIRICKETQTPCAVIGNGSESACLRYRISWRDHPDRPESESGLGKW